MNNNTHIDISGAPVVKFDLQKTNRLIGQLAEQIRQLPPVDLTKAAADFSAAVREHMKEITGKDVAVTTDLVDKIVDDILSADE